MNRYETPLPTRGTRQPGFRNYGIEGSVDVTNPGIYLGL